MKEQLVSFQVAKLAKEKGFNWKVINYFKLSTISNPLIEDECRPQNINSLQSDSIFSRPTQSLLAKWLREEHNIHIKIDDFIDDETGIEWDYEIVIIGTDLDERGNYIPLISYDMNNSIERKFKTYEEALELGLQEALKLI